MIASCFFITVCHLSKSISADYLILIAIGDILFLCRHCDKETDIIFQITSTENQKENEYKDISTIQLGQCETILKGI